VFPFTSRKSQDIFVGSGAGPVTVNVYGATSWLARDVPRLIAGGVVVRASAGVNVVTAFVAVYGGLGTRWHFMAAPLALEIEKTKIDVTINTSAATDCNHRTVQNRDSTPACSCDI
jgi:hypothetical protein